MHSYYTLQVAGLERDLLVCPLNESLSIAAFILFGDVELTTCCAAELMTFCTSITPTTATNKSLYTTASLIFGWGIFYGFINNFASSGF